MNCTDTEVVTKFTSGIRLKRRRKKKIKVEQVGKFCSLVFFKKFQ